MNQERFEQSLAIICSTPGYTMLSIRLLGYLWGLQDANAPQDKIETVFFLLGCCAELMQEELRQIREKGVL